jgi:hypothetical protein
MPKTGDVVCVPLRQRSRRTLASRINAKNPEKLSRSAIGRGEMDHNGFTTNRQHRRTTT